MPSPLLPIASALTRLDGFRANQCLSVAPRGFSLAFQWLLRAFAHGSALLLKIGNPFELSDG